MGILFLLKKCNFSTFATYYLASKIYFQQKKSDLPNWLFSCKYECNFKRSRKIKHIFQSSGEWSGTIPYCKPVRCTALEILDAHLRVLSLNNSFQGQASFLCPFGYALVGPESIQCGPDGKW